MQIFLMIAAGMIGWITGAIINYFADVLPEKRRLIGSACANCNSNILASRYLFLRKCPICGQGFSHRHPIIQWSIFLSYLGMAYFLAGDTTKLVQSLIVISYFTLVIVIDIEHHLILHTVSFVGTILLGIIGVLRHDWLNTLLGGGVGLGVMLLLYAFGILFSKEVSKRRGEEIEEGLGFGDVILSLVCGLLLGWPGISLCLFGGILAGGIYSLGLLIYTLLKKKYQPYMAIPYGPFLAGAAMLVWMFK